VHAPGLQRLQEMDQILRRGTLVEQHRHHTAFHIPFGIGVEAEGGIFLHAVDRGGRVMLRCSSLSSIPKFAPTASAS
jgi:hypothetical protein